MAHEAYGPVGYDYNADNYCLDCIPRVIAANYESVYVQDDGCNCTECVLDRIASDRGINRQDESSYDMSVFPKHIPYFNDLHADCQAEESWDWHWTCGARCAECGDIIDGTERVLSDGVWHWICPGYDQYLDNHPESGDDDA